ncbi:hypothetical protein QRD21_12605 [Klebsiella michiganensis]|uniref:hypothetical protein n=1 Tax=Klebsiella michiganensis TaxID=1134687 RepID=UPI00256FEDD5|nr:hypothetical protein [Klebsiella michiganensis]WJD77907.1 hypothetical protein QRD21_12605 [Klebsiella michiganensis]
MTITLQVNELIQSLESAGEMSIKEQKYLDVMRWAIRVAGERDATLNAERVWEKTMMEACGEDGPASVANEIRSLRALRDTAIQALKSQVKQLAAENVAMKAAISAVNRTAEECELNGDKLKYAVEPSEFEALTDLLDETPATDRIVAGIKADGVTAALESCSDYLDTDCVMDRLDISYEDAEKRTSGAIEFQDAMVNFANQLREGADK